MNAKEAVMAKILIVDDDPLVVATIKSILKQKSYETASASSGRQAVEILQTDDFDMAICDMIMPDMEGLETITHLKRLKPEMPVIAISGGGRTKNLDFLRMAENLGAIDSLSKPFAGPDLMGIVEKYIQVPTHAAS
jgi:DNA-binding NtrC family response regulator